MYLDYFGLRQKPFLITPDPTFLYPSQIHQQALAHLHYGLEREGGFILLTGEVGTGKTTLCRLLIEELPEKFRLAYILNTKLDSAGVLAGICKELNIPVSDSRDVNALVAAIYDDLLAVHGNNRHTLVVIEEAQNLAPDVLETLRLLTNLETHSTKLLHILLIGQPELLDTLAQPGLRQLNQRVVSRCHLGPLTRNELLQYMPHRIKMAGSTRPLFTEGAIGLIHKKTGGIPRLVNLLAEHCLMGAYGQGKEKVTAPIVRQAALELRDTLKPLSGMGTGNTSSVPWWSWAAAAVICLGVGYAFTSSKYMPFSSALSENSLTSSSAAKPVSTENEESVKEEPNIGAPLSTGDVSAKVKVSPDGKSSQSVAKDFILPGAIQQLALSWGIEGSFESIESLCSYLEYSTQSLVCESASLIELADVLAIDRPLLVNLRQDADGWSSYTLMEVSDTEISLSNSAGMMTLPPESFFHRVQGEATFIWQKPKSYDKPLLLDQANPPLVALVQEGLRVQGYLSETLVTGGVFNEYLSSLVARFQQDRGLDVDGIVGVRTLLHLNATPGPRLMASETRATEITAPEVPEA